MVLCGVRVSLFSYADFNLFNYQQKFVHLFGSCQIHKYQSYKEKRLLGYSQEQMYNITVGVGNYSKFLPWCKESIIIGQFQTYLIARLGVGFPPFYESYISRVTYQKPNFVKSVAQKGQMFNFLVNEWKFSPGLPDNPNTCIVEFSVNFEFRSVLHSKVAGLFFDQVVKVMITAFVNRAYELYGRASIPPQEPQIITYNK